MVFAIEQGIRWMGVVVMSFLFSLSSQAAPRLAFQVYAVRDLCAKDFVGTLKAAKAMGYEGVETGRFYGLDAKGLKAACDEAGLELVALQLYPHNLTEPQLSETIRFCKGCGCNRINVAWYKGSKENPNDWQLLVNVLNHAAEVCAKEGITVAYHNHDHEFRMRVQGKTVWEWLWDGKPGDSLRQVTATPRFSPRVMQELDCGNCVLGGGDPVYWLDRFPHRNPTVHVMPAIRDTAGLKPGEAGVGSVRDAAHWPEIIAALRRNGTEWLVVKPTTFPGSLDDLAASYAYLRPLLLQKAAGK
jgi:sugar phosphate isomerase/epimerase